MSDDLLPGLREELVAAAWRARGRHRRRRMFVGAAAAAAIAVIAVIGTLAAGSSDQVAAGVEIEIVDDRVVVELTDVETRPAVVEAALRDVGFDATVSAAPVGPSNVGRFLGVVSDLPPAVEPEGLDIRSFAAFSAPVGLRDRLDLILGRPADDGEEYVYASDAFAPGEPLSCSDLYLEPLDRLAAFAPSHPELEITVLAQRSTGATPVDLDQLETDPSLGDLRLVDAFATSARSVTVVATPDGVAPGVEPIDPDRGACRE